MRLNWLLILTTCIYSHLTHCQNSEKKMTDPGEGIGVGWHNDYEHEKQNWQVEFELQLSPFDFISHQYP